MARLVPALAISTALAAAPAGAQVLEEWDLDDDGAVDEAEFRQGFSEDGLFDRWDRDADDRIGEDEFIRGIYRLWDMDGDGTLSVEEWDRAVDRWFGEAEVDLSVGAWDDNGNGTISREEFRTAMEEADLFARVEDPEDADDLLTEQELATGFFEVADVDEDTFLGEEEDMFLVDLLEVFNAPDEEVVLEDGDLEGTPAEAPGAEEPATADVEPVDQAGADLIERGERFVQLPVPCGTAEGEGEACEATAERFCSALGYGPPIDFLAAQEELYVIRCGDDI